MLEAIAVQVGQAGALTRASPILPPPVDPPAAARGASARADTAAGPVRAGEASEGTAADRPRLAEKSGLIDKRGLLSAQADETEEERQRRKDPEGLTEEERAIVKELQARDREVRAHEQAHARVGGQYAGSPSYQFETGPDGKRYAVSGQVKIDVSPVRGDPEATIRKMDQVKKAALAPAEPSAQDRAVASKAEAVKAKARSELSQQRAQEQREAREEKAAESNAGTAEGSAASAAARPGENTAPGGLLEPISPGADGETEPGSPGFGSRPESSGREVSEDGSRERRFAEAVSAYNGSLGRSASVSGFRGAADATHVLNLVT